MSLCCVQNYNGELDLILEMHPTGRWDQNDFQGQNC